jgi:hypothetical protein
MFTPRRFVSAALSVAFTITSLGAGLGISAQQRAFRVSPQQVDQLLQRIELQSNQFRQSLADALDWSRIDGTRQENNMNEFVRNFGVATATLRDRFRSRQDVAADVSEVLSRAAFIDRFMGRNRLASNAEQLWIQLRSNLDVLAQYYNVTWRWDAGYAGQAAAGPGRSEGTGRGGFGNRLTGTYTVDSVRSDKVGRTARIATRGISPEEQQRLRDMISRRLEAPEMIAIQRGGFTVTIASTRGPQVTFDADGRTRIEQTSLRGLSVQVTSKLVGDKLSVTSVGNRGNDFTVTFEPLNNGRELRVTRSMDVEGLTQPVVAYSYYNKTSEVAQLDLYREASPVVGGGASSLPGTQLFAILDTGLSTRQAREGDGFSLTVQSPSQFEGAVIGAIAGGGKGAAIGAAVGAGAGAGSVFIQGRDDLELVRGTQFTIRANLSGH